MAQTLNNMSQRKLLFTTVFDKKIAAELTDNRLTGVYLPEERSKVGAIYIGKVKNVVKNINACFVEIEDGELAFLSLKEAENALILNRPADGRILQEDELLVQVQRDAIKTKQAGLTAKVDLSSEYFVFSLGNPKLGISAKLDKTTKDTLKSLLIANHIIEEEGNLIPAENMPSYGLVLRTASGELLQQSGKEILLTKLKEQHKQFIDLVSQAHFRTCFRCLLPPPSIYPKALTYLGCRDYEEIITDDTAAYEDLKDMGNVRFYQDDMLSLPKLYGLESKLKEALSPNVWLKSGASLVIEQTEALNVIDVNSGKFDKKTMSKDTILQINLEAAKEIALQIRLRNLTGIIIVDFISMKSAEQEEKLLQELRRQVSTDSVPTKVIDITALGLVEITRQRGYKSLKEQWQ